MEYSTVIEVWFEAHSDERANQIVSTLHQLVNAEEEVTMVESTYAEAME